VNGQHLLNGFPLDEDLIVHEQIDAVSAVDADAALGNRSRRSLNS
jgi:hypothetical protein